ncbi:MULTISPECIES: hypothetical protein [unclassified Nostoc]|uniref:hypothetical protein n=1 Tax=unclassified Nostoc TaxID=2593658 RepID=UPI0025AB3002|nr:MULTISPECIES: hypothetical protein [unclassified Nostoc]MDM9583264.1 hypothetical protein [Nostoc sp. GT001]MDZ7943566.1 hypothetical protein [Nostoc sp. EfeVER01]MDZ7993506.1 hypothetical protein [Nostoc sp. EspVER01]
MHLQNICEENLALRQVLKEFYSVIHQVKFETMTVLLNINTPEIYQEKLNTKIPDFLEKSGI